MSQGSSPAPDPARPGQWIATVACPAGCSRLTGHGRTPEEAERALAKAMRRRRWRKEEGRDYCSLCEPEEGGI